MEPSTSQKTPTRDRSDQKATLQLMDQLKLLQNRSASKEKPKLKNISKTPRTRRRKLKFEDDHHPKITSWLNKENCETKAKKNVHNPLDITVIKSGEDKKQPKEKKTKSNRLLRKRSSFDKYGIVMPSFEKIVADQEKFEKHKDSVKLLDVFDNEILEKTVPTDCFEDIKFTGELLDCKHLTLEDLDDYFYQYMDILEAIMKGKKYSERHNRFHNHNNNSGSVATDLRCSTSTVVFTEEQREHLLDLLSLQFDPDNKMTSYFFKVLLPELCLLIFMAEHDMSKRKATLYLDKRPLDI